MAKTQITKWDEEYARQAAEAARQEAAVGGGQFLSTRGGQLSFGGTPQPNNELAALILGSVNENVLYEGGFDPDSPSSPVCYAFGTDESTMAPHEAVENPQSERCKGCEHNEWGSGKGRGKSCRNMRRVALIPGGTINQGKFTPFPDVETYQNAQLAFLKVPPTSLNGWATFVKQLAQAMKRPPWAVFTQIKIVSDPKTQFKVTFTAITEIPPELREVAQRRHEEAMEALVFPYPKFDEAPKSAKAAPGRGRRF